MVQQSSENAQEILDRFLVWLKINRIWYAEDMMKIYFNVTSELKDKTNRNGLKQQLSTSGYDFGLVAKKDIEVDTIVCKIPKKSVLSCRNSGLANIFEDENIVSEVGLPLAIIYEKSIGDRSPWFDYLNTMQEFENSPMFWAKEELDLLKGTHAIAILEKNMEILKEDYETLVEPLIKKYPHIFDVKVFDYDSFAKATSLVCSRAFQVDEYHQDAMVPLADMFNHKSGAENIHLESDEVCPNCGSDEACFCGMDIDDGQEMDDSNSQCSDDSMISLIDPEEVDSGYIKSEIDEQLCFDTDKDYEVNQQIAFNVVLKCKKDKEIFNTYGIKNNSTLLVLYGFAELDNPNEFVEFELDDIIELFIKKYKIKEDEINERIQFWTQCVEAVAIEEEEEETEVYDEEGELEGSDEAEEFQESDGDEDQDDFDEMDEQEEMAPMPIAPLQITRDGVMQPFIMLIYILFMSEKKIIELSENDIEEEMQQYFESILDQWIQHLQQWEIRRTQNKKVRKQKLNGELNEKLANKMSELIRELINSRLAEFEPPTSIEMDYKKLEQASNNREKYATICRITEKEVLLNCLNSLPL